MIVDRLERDWPGGVRQGHGTGRRRGSRGERWCNLRPWRIRRQPEIHSDPDGLAPVVSPGEEQSIPRRGSYGAPGAFVRSAIPIDREGVAEFSMWVQFPEHGGRAE